MVIIAIIGKYQAESPKSGWNLALLEDPQKRKGGGPPMAPSAGRIHHKDP